MSYEGVTSRKTESDVQICKYENVQIDEEVLLRWISMSNALLFADSKMKTLQSIFCQIF